MPLVSLLLVLIVYTCCTTVMDGVMLCLLYTLLVICVVFPVSSIILSYICSTYFMIIYASLLNELDLC